jgi:hypothetical protein
MQKTAEFLLLVWEIGGCHVAEKSGEAQEQAFSELHKEKEREF